MSCRSTIDQARPDALPERLAREAEAQVCDHVTTVCREWAAYAIRAALDEAKIIAIKESRALAGTETEGHATAARIAAAIEALKA